LLFIYFLLLHRSMRWRSKAAAAGSALYLITVVVLTFLIAVGVPVAGAVQESRYPEGWWVTLVFYVGTLALILSILIFLFKASKGIGEEIDEDLTRLMSIFLVILVASFSLAGGVQWLGRVSGVDGFVYQRANSFLDTQLQETIRTYEKVLLLYETIKVLSALEVNILVVKVKVGDLFEPITKLIDKLLDSVFVFVAAISMHKVLLVFGHNYAMSTLFPLGVVLWVFPWTRKAGSLLIAVAIALWFVFPFTVILILEQTSKLVNQDPSPFLSLPVAPEFGEALKRFWSTKDIDAAKEVLEEIAKLLVKEGGDVPGIILKKLLYDFIEALFNWWAQMFVTWLLVPAINIAFLVTVVMNLADAIGGEAKPFARMAKFLFPR